MFGFVHIVVIVRDVRKEPGHVCREEVLYQRIYYWMLRDLGIAGDGYYR